MFAWANIWLLHVPDNGFSDPLVLMNSSMGVTVSRIDDVTTRGDPTKSGPRCYHARYAIACSYADLCSAYIR